MPFVRISLKGNRSEKERLSIGDCVHRALVKAIGIPEGDRFQVITEHNTDLVLDSDYLNIHRTDGIIMIQITLASGRTVELRKHYLKPWLSFLPLSKVFGKKMCSSTCWKRPAKTGLLETASPNMPMDRLPI